MKPAPFAYVAPASVEEALQLLSQYGEDAKLLAGGQSLMPLLNMRLATPKVVIDINGLTELDYMRLEGDMLCIGALTRQYKLEQAPLVQKTLPFLLPVVRLIGHPPIRYAGTVGGSLAHADPAAELPAAMCALQAELNVIGPAGTRGVKSDDFFLSYLTVDLQPDEILAGVRIPVPSNTVWGVHEYTRRAGDFALAGAAVVMELEGPNHCAEARVVLFGVSDRPLRAPAAESFLAGRSLSSELADDVAAAAVEGIECEADIHATSGFRKHLAQVMARRAFLDAVALAEGKRHGAEA